LVEQKKYENGLNTKESLKLITKELKEIVEKQKKAARDFKYHKMQINNNIINAEKRQEDFKKESTAATKEKSKPAHDAHKDTEKHAEPTSGGGGKHAEPTSGGSEHDAGHGHK
jgi:hypothetical protein